MRAILEFIVSILDELLDLKSYAEAGQPDPEKEAEIAKRLVRKAIDAQAKKEIGDANP